VAPTAIFFNLCVLVVVIVPTFLLDAEPLLAVVQHSQPDGAVVDETSVVVPGPADLGTL
jgi:hypothetical protein